MNTYLASLAFLPRKIKILIMVVGDLILLPLAFWSAIALRYGTYKMDVSPFWWLFVLLPVVTVPIFVRIGLYRTVIRYLDEHIIRTVIYGVTFSLLLLIAAISMFQVQGLPRTSLVIYWIIATSYIAASRYAARGLLRRFERKERRKQKVAIYGAGKAGLQTALALMNSPEYKPVIFFDDHQELHGTTVAGIRVYSPREAEVIMDKHNCTELLLALPSASRSKKKEIIQRFEGKNFQLKTIPGIGELVTGRVKVDNIREVGIEDLLGRDPVPPFEQLISFCIQHKVVLVTGAGGSIGSELCRQILKHKPEKLVLYERSEYALYKMSQELDRVFTGQVIVPILGDVLDQSQVEKAIKEHRVETIYHAAAYKHVPLVETNVIAGVMNNVFGTWNVAQAAINSNVKNFVLVSTDKAVRPTNVMGASKRLAELVLQGLAGLKPGIRFCIVRFGNVLGSSGSVVPLFREQIKNGGPVTVTHPEVTRYFMTIPEAAQLVIQASALGEGGEVFVLDMGDSIKIVDLARNMIELSGFEVKNTDTGLGDIAIRFVGLRPGEKLYEELLIGDKVAKTLHPRIMKADEDCMSWQDLEDRLHKIKIHCLNGESAKVLHCLREVMPEYQPVKYE